MGGFACLSLLLLFLLVCGGVFRSFWGFFGWGFFVVFLLFVDIKVA